MNLWTGLAVALLTTAQVFAAPTPSMPMPHSDGGHSSAEVSSYIAPSSHQLQNLPITWSQGFLALVRSDAPNDTILRWDADTVECPGTVYSAWFHPKNFGPEDITLCAPVEPESHAYSRVTDCLCYNTLGAGEMSPCSLQIEFHPTAEGIFLDTLRMQTDAWNSYGGFVRIPLSGTCTTTPASPNVVINVTGADADLFWRPINSSIGGCNTSVTGYFVFYSPDNSGLYRLLDFTVDTSYVHTGVILTEGGLFYQVIAGTQALNQMRSVQHGLSENQVLNLLK